MKNDLELFDNRSRRKGIYWNEQFKFLKRRKIDFHIFEIAIIQ